MVKNIKQLILRKHVIPVILVLLLAIPAFTTNFQKGYFSMHDDLQVMRLYIMNQCFNDHQIPCRWSQDMGYEYGYPLFNFYPPLPYYTGQLFHVFGLSFVDTVKALVVLTFLISGLTMYLLAQEFWGRWGGLVAAVLYVYAPYHAVEIYVRGAMDEFFSSAFFPAVYWSLYKVVTEKKPVYVMLSAFFIAMLMLSHNPILMIFAPTAVAWVLFWLVKTKNFSAIFPLGLSGLWALGLAAFFTLPVIFEQQYVHVETLTMGYFNYLAHYVGINQLFFSRFWGYGPSVLGPNDGMSFQIGYLHWGLLIAAGLLIIKELKKKPYLSVMTALMIGITLVALFMIHPRSVNIWNALPPLSFLQFPWRFLTIVMFTTSFLAGSVVLLIPNWHKKVLTSVVVVLLLTGTLLLYKDYFHWNNVYPQMNDQAKLSGKEWQMAITASIFDYLPKSAPRPPADKSPGNSEIISGEGDVSTIFKDSDLQEYKVAVKKEADFQINTYYFPGWTYYINGKKVSVDWLDKALGLPNFKLSPGNYTVEAKLENTPVREVGDGVSLLAWVLLLGLTAQQLGRHFAKNCRFVCRT